MEAYGTGEHMNTHGIAGRLPPGQLDTKAFDGHGWRELGFPILSCMVYLDSSWAEICIPWVIAATPGQSYEYGVNMPNFGSMTLERNQTTSTAHDPLNQQIDLFFTTDSGSAAGGVAKSAAGGVANTKPNPEEASCKKPPKNNNNLCRWWAGLRRRRGTSCCNVTSCGCHWMPLDTRR